MSTKHWPWHLYTSDFGVDRTITKYITILLNIRTCRWFTFISYLLNHSTCCKLLDSNIRISVHPPYLSSVAVRFFLFFFANKNTLNTCCIESFFCAPWSRLLRSCWQFTNLAVKHRRKSSVSSSCRPLPMCTHLSSGQPHLRTKRFNCPLVI